MKTADEYDPIQSIKDLASEMGQRALAEQYVIIPAQAITDVEKLRELKFGVRDALVSEILPSALVIGIGGALGKDWPLVSKGLVLLGGLWWPVSGAGHYLRLLNEFRNHYNYFVHKYVHLGRLGAHSAALASLALAWPHLGFLPFWAKAGIGLGSLIALVPVAVWKARGKPPEESEYARLLRQLLEEAEQAPAPSLAKIAQAGVTCLGRGILLHDSERGYTLTCEGAKKAKPRPVALSRRERSTHMAVWATTGTGKTWTLNYLVRQDLAEGYNVAVVDPKGDSDLLNGLIESLMITGRLGELVLIAPYWTHVTDQFNPLAGFNFVEELVDVISTMASTQVPSSGESQFFFGMLKRITRDIVTVLLALQEKGEERTITIRDITSWASYSRLMALIPEAQRLGLDRIVHDLRDLASKGELTYGKIASSLETGLHPIVAGQVSNVMLAPRNPIAERLLAGKRTVLYIRSASLRDRDFATLLTLAAVGALKALAGVLLDRGGKVEPDLRIHIDEAYRALFPGIEDFLDKGRSVGLHTTLYFQDDAQLEKALDRTLERIIKANLGTILWFRLRSEQAAGFGEKMMPEVERLTPQLLFSSGQQQQARGSMAKKQPLVTKTEFLYLPDRHYISTRSKSVWRGVMPSLPAPLLTVVPPGKERTGCVPVPRAIELIRQGQPAKVHLEAVMEYVRKLRGEEPLPVEVQPEKKKEKPTETEERQKETAQEPKPAPSPPPQPAQPVQDGERRKETAVQPSSDQAQERQEKAGKEELEALLEEARRLIGEEKMEQVEVAAFWVRKNWDHPSFTHVWGKHTHVVYQHLAGIKLGEHLVRTARHGLRLYQEQMPSILPAFVERLILACLLHDAGKTTAARGSEHPGESVAIAHSLGINDEAVCQAIAHHHYPLNKVKEPLDRLVIEADRAARQEEIRQLEERGFQVLSVEEAMERWFSQRSLDQALEELEEMAYETQKSLARREGWERPIHYDEEENIFWTDPELVALPLSRQFLDWDRERIVVAGAMFVDAIKPALAEALRRRGVLAPSIGRDYYANYIALPDQAADPRLRKTKRVMMTGWVSPKKEPKDQAQPGSSQKEEGA